MASFKITDLTELASGSVNDSDVLEIVDLDADESKKVTIASLKTVFTGEVTAWGEITGTLSSQTDLQSALDGKLNTTAAVNDLSDVDAASPTNGQALIFNSTSGYWESSNINDDSAIWGNISGTLSSQSDLQSALNAKLNTTAVIDDLSNVDAASPSNGESLIYNATSGNWEANTISTSTTWGSITGTLSSQTDLQSALNGKLNTSAVINDLSDIDAATPSNGEILIYNSVSGNWENGSTSATSWGSITGTLSSQTDLQSALDAKLNTTSVIDDLSDVDASAPSNGEALVYNSTSGNWESNTITTSTAWGDITGTLSSQSDLQTALNGKLDTTAVIDDLSDVSVPSPSNGQSLVYNSTSGNWEANTVSTSTAWGDITGTLSSQSDLQSALNGKLDTTAVIDDLSDVNAPTPSNGEALVYNSLSGNWESSVISASTTWGSITGTLSSQTDLQSALNLKLDTTAVIDDLSDINAASPSNGQALIYNSTSGDWENGSISNDAAIWGNITGTLSSQTDLQSALNGKLNTTAVINDISDVDVPTPSNGESLVYNSTSGNWEASTVSASVSWGGITGTLSSQTDLQSALDAKLDTTAVIDDLSDVDAATPSNGETLIYNSTSGNWENGSAGGGGVSIGDSIGGATNNAVLFVDGSGLLAQNSKFTFNGSTLNFTGPSSTNTSNSSYGVTAGNSNFGTSNTSIGYVANANSTGSSMTSIGRSAGQLATSNESAFVGYEAGYSSSGIRAVYMGYRAGRGNSGYSCVGVGDYALFNGTGNSNAALGTSAMNSSTTSQSVACGARSLLFGTGSENSALGYQALYQNSGSQVLALGYNAGNSNTQSNRVIVGQQNLPQFAGAAAAAAALPASSANGVYLYWDTTDNTIKARP